MALIEYKTKYKVPDILKEEQTEYTDELTDCIRQIQKWGY